MRVADLTDLSKLNPKSAVRKAKKPPDIHLRITQSLRNYRHQGPGRGGAWSKRAAESPCDQLLGVEIPLQLPEARWLPLSLLAEDWRIIFSEGLSRRTLVWEDQAQLRAGIPY